MNNIIDKLTQDLKPVKPPPSPQVLCASWLIASFVILSALYWMTGTIRQSALLQLQTSTRFLVEFCVGLAVVLFSTISVFQMARPDDNRSKFLPKFSIALFILYSGLVAYDVINPAFETTNQGHRYLCTLEILGFSVLPYVMIVMFLKKWAPTNLRWMGIMAMLSSMGLTTMMMQMACKYDPEHILIFHLAPLIIAVLVGGKLGDKFLNWRN